MKKIIIIGGGIAGLSAGIFAQKAGFQSVIYEKNMKMGGVSTYWGRDAYHIEGSLRWFKGIKEGSNFNRLWKELGVFENTQTIIFDSIASLKHKEGLLSIYQGYERLKEEFMSIAPEDEKAIDELIDDLKLLANYESNVDLPYEMRGLLTKYRVHKKSKVYEARLKKLSKLSVKEYCQRFSNRLLRSALYCVTAKESSADNLLIELAHYMNGNSGWIMGGSRTVVDNLVRKYTSLGGKIVPNTEINEIVVEKDVAIGVKLPNGIIDNADAVVSTCDIRVTLHRLLKKKYEDSLFMERFDQPNLYPLPSFILLSFVANKDLSHLPESIVIDSDFEFGNKKYRKLAFRHFSYEQFAPKGKTMMVVLLNTDSKEYDYWNYVNQNTSQYVHNKAEFAGAVAHAIETEFPDLRGHIQLVDMATPITYERMTNSYRGAARSFSKVSGAKPMFHPGKIKGLKNFYLAGQWLLPPGGLPQSMVSAKWAIQRICKDNKMKYKF